MKRGVGGGGGGGFELKCGNGFEGWGSVGE